MKRNFDLVFCLLALFILLIPILIIYLLIKISSPGKALYWSKRIGKNNQIFQMPKFRSMYEETPELATDLLEDPQKYITKIGRFLRKNSLDELPQIWNIIKGEMSFVGPRPALYNQHDLIKMRTEKNIHLLTPGLTGWAQVNGRDNISSIEKVNYDFEYLKKNSIYFDIKIIALTFFKVVKKEDIL